MKTKTFKLLKNFFLLSFLINLEINLFGTVLINDSFVFIESYNNRTPLIKVPYKQVLKNFNEELSDENKIKNLEDFSLWKGMHFINNDYCKICKKTFVNDLHEEEDASDFFMIIKFKFNYFNEFDNHSNTLLGFIPSLMVSGLSGGYNEAKINLKSHPAIYFPGLDFSYENQNEPFSFANIFWDQLEKHWVFNSSIFTYKNLPINSNLSSIMFEKIYISLPFSNNKYNKINNKINNSSLDEAPLVKENRILNIDEFEGNNYKILINNKHKKDSTISLLKKDKNKPKLIYKISENIFLKELKMRECEIEKLIKIKPRTFNYLSFSDELTPAEYMGEYSSINKMIPQKNYYVVFMKLVDIYSPKKFGHPALNFVNDLYGIVDVENVINGDLDLTKEIKIIFPGTETDENYNYIDTSSGGLKYASAEYNPKDHFWRFFGNLANDCRFFYETKKIIGGTSEDPKTQEIIKENNPNIGWIFYNNYEDSLLHQKERIEGASGRLKFSEICRKILKKSSMEKIFYISSILNKYDGPTLSFLNNKNYFSQYIILNDEEALEIIDLDKKINLINQYDYYE